ncbi:hypothetical protein FE257_005013 [Aspergillus nanangensis]|uniref:LEA domain protein n=1 Tax=Aspergillus nanangensis TaxID=2582783 RepID=A0AAD4CSQ4_ASPNN|nr:hypothetical protein FE257_005013 [Aspergillus nanangensis]
MSFLTRITPRTARVAAMNPVPIFATRAARPISSTTRRDNGPIKETLKKVDQTVSGAAAKGIEKGEQARDKIKDAVGKTMGEAEADAGKFKGEASEVAGKAKGAAEEAFGQAKGKAKETAGDVKGKAKEAAGEVKS